MATFVDLLAVAAASVLFVAFALLQRHRSGGSCDAGSVDQCETCTRKAGCPEPYDDRVRE